MPKIAPRTLARLKTLQAFDRLGAGFAISARDLDQRGAGDLLSDEQSGHVKLIGVDLYQHLLESAVRQARGEVVDEWTPALNLGVGGRFPGCWIPEEDVRVGLAVRLARTADLSALDAFEEELADRFGELPDEARRVLGIARVRVLARAAGSTGSTPGLPRSASRRADKSVATRRQLASSRMATASCCARQLPIPLSGWNASRLFLATWSQTRFESRKRPPGVGRY